MTDLSSSYEDAVTLWLRLLPSHPQMSAPQLVHPTDAYRQTRTRLMIVGQETLGWGDNDSVPRDKSVPDICAALRQGYRDFNLGGRYGHTPFWSASNRLFHALNPEATERAFIWTNLVKIDDGGKRPSPDIVEQTAALALLEAEVRAFEPQVVVFFTGPNYDALLQRTFRGVVLSHVAKSLARVEHPALPVNSFRTYHPRYLRMSKQWPVLDAIVEQCQ